VLALKTHTADHITFKNIYYPVAGHFSITEISSLRHIGIEDDGMFYFPGRNIICLKAFSPRVLNIDFDVKCEHFDNVHQLRIFQI